MELGRYQRPSQTGGDTTVSNGIVTVVGILGVSLNQTEFPVLGGIPWLDAQTGEFWNITGLGGDISGTPDNVKIVQINNGAPLNSSQIAARIHARQ